MRTRERDDRERTGALPLGASVASDGTHGCLDDRHRNRPVTNNTRAQPQQRLFVRDIVRRSGCNASVLHIKRLVTATAVAVVGRRDE